MFALLASVPHRPRQIATVLAPSLCWLAFSLVLTSCDRPAATPTAPLEAATTPTPGVATKLSFTGNPRNVAAGAVAPAVQVTVLDGLGTPVPSYTGQVSVAIAPGTGTVGATLAGTTTIAAVGGVATFSTLSIATPGSGYRLVATATGLTSATSGSFFVAGAATTLGFTVEPPTTAAVGVAFSPPLRLTLLDALGNRALGFTGLVALAITPGTGTSGAALLGTTSVAASAGVATFYSLHVNIIGTGYTLTATAATLTAKSTPFAVALGPASKLVFSVQPRSTAAGSAITPAVQVQAVDAGGNLVPTFTGNVTMVLSASCPTGATLAGTTTVAAVGGVATFATLSIATPGSCRLAAQATGLTSATSTSFTISGPATQLVFTVEPPATAQAHVPFSPAVHLTALDALGNRALGFAGSVTIAITPGTGTSGALLDGTKTVTASAGVATFWTLWISKVGTGYTLTVASTGLASATSTPITNTPGPAASSRSPSTRGARRQGASSVRPCRFRCWTRRTTWRRTTRGMCR